MNERIPLTYPYTRLTFRLYRLTDRHPAVCWLTSPLWKARWRYFAWRGPRDARRPVYTAAELEYERQEMARVEDNMRAIEAWEAEHPDE